MITQANVCVWGHIQRPCHRVTLHGQDNTEVDPEAYFMCRQGFDDEPFSPLQPTPNSYVVKHAETTMQDRRATRFSLRSSSLRSSQADKLCTYQASTYRRDPARSRSLPVSRVAHMDRSSYTGARERTGCEDCPVTRAIVLRSCKPTSQLRLACPFPTIAASTGLETFADCGI